MARRGPSKPVNAHFGAGRLALAKAFKLAAANAAELAEEEDAGNPIMSLIVSSAIAYTDALTARIDGRANQQDHAATIKALRGALGKRLPKDQERRLARILGEKDAAQYGDRIRRMADAMKLLADLEKFAVWAENELESQ